MMERNIILKNFLTIINNYSKLNVTDENYICYDLLYDCGLNSINIIELICDLEEKFNIIIYDENLSVEKIRYIDKLFIIIYEKLMK